MSHAAERTPMRAGSSLPLKMLAGLVLGLAVGMMWPSIGKTLQPIGTAFIQAIQMIVIPLIFSAVTLGVYRMGENGRQLGRVAIVAFGWFYLATLFAVLIGLGLNGLFHPGVGANLVPTGSVPPNLALSVDWTKYVLDLIPTNIVAAMAAQRVLPTLLFAVLFGLGLARIGETARSIVSLLEAVMATMFRVTGWIIATAPFAIFAIMAWLFATQGLATIAALARLIGLMYLGLFAMVACFWVVLALLRENPLAISRQVLEPVLLGFTTRSSEVTLPVHMETLERMGVPNKVVSLVLPLGYSFNLDGSTLYITLAVTFLAEAYHLQLTWASEFTILVTAMIASKGIANIPSGGLVALATVLTAIGLPVEAIAVVAGVDVFMDMGRTAVNVFGNTVAVKLVQRFGGLGLAEPDMPAVVAAGTATPL
ncbi:MAG: dicarboxylate/amino acid:cation symporter [Acetobacteraceae bacterium]|nr:dicarboxylate/amino acid:cation symporter [Acetobacteraceae bacterium]